MDPWIDSGMYTAKTTRYMTADSTTNSMTRPYPINVLLVFSLILHIRRIIRKVAEVVVARIRPKYAFPKLMYVAGLESGSFTKATCAAMPRNPSANEII